MNIHFWIKYMDIFLIQGLGCVDDPSIDCTRLSSLINICDDAERAMTICPNFCNMCPIGIYLYLKHIIYG